MEIEATPTPGRIKEDVKLIKEWMSKQPHLPEVTDEEWVATALHHNKYSLEKTKYKLDNYFSFRTKYPEILKNRDPTSSEILQARSAYIAVWADRLTKDNEQLAFGQMQPDTSIFDMKAFLKMLFMFCDTTYLENKRYSHIILITDCRYLSYKHFLKALPWLSTMVEIFFLAYSDRIKAAYVVNVPAHLDKVVNTVKGFLPKNIAERFYAYPTVGNLCKVVDENVVCSDLGGKGPSLAEYDKYTTERMKKYREWFLAQNNVCSNEALRRKTDNRIEDMQGSFRKLEVD